MATDWSVVTAGRPGEEPVRLALPPDWVAIHTADEDLGEQIGDLVRRFVPATTDPRLRAEIGDEWRRLGSAASAGGAALLAFGSAVDPIANRIVSASLLLAPRRWYPIEQVAEPLPGPVHTFDLPGGVVERRLFLTRTPSPLGDLAELVVDYTARPPGNEPWALVVRTTALRHVSELMVVFDSIATSIVASAGAADDEPAFS